MKKTSGVIKFGDVANFTYDKNNNVTKIFIENENYLPNILKLLWRRYSRDEEGKSSKERSLSRRDEKRKIRTESVICSSVGGQ